MCLFMDCLTHFLKILRQNLNVTNQEFLAGEGCEKQEKKISPEAI